jgi:hypothetical protein
LEDVPGVVATEGTLLLGVVGLEEGLDAGVEIPDMTLGDVERNE